MGPAPNINDSASVPLLTDSALEVVVRKRTFKFAQTNDYCQGPRNVRLYIEAADGSEIRLDSLRVEATHGS